MRFPPESEFPVKSHVWRRFCTMHSLGKPHRMSQKRYGSDFIRTHIMNHLVSDFSLNLLIARPDTAHHPRPKLYIICELQIAKNVLNMMFVL